MGKQMKEQKKVFQNHRYYQFCLLTVNMDVSTKTCVTGRVLCKIKLLPVTHVLVDTWMLTGKPVYKLLNVSDDLKWTTNTRETPFSFTFKA